MLHSFSIDNYRSINARQEVSFIAPKPAPGDARFTDPGASARGLSLAKALAVTGGNGSGKTNVIKALHFLYYFVTASAFDDDAGGALPLVPFRFQREKRPTRMSIAAECLGEEYAYEAVVSTEEVLLETLLRVDEDGSRRLVFHRALEGGSYALNGPGLSERSRQSALAAGRKVSAVSAVVAAADDNEPTGVEGFFRCFINWRHSLFDVALSELLDELKEAFAARSGLARRTLAVARSFGLRLGEVEYLDKPATKYNILLERLEFARKLGHGRAEAEIAALEQSLLQAERSNARRIVCAHTVEGREYRLPLGQESIGTQRLLGLLLRILEVLDSGGVALLDVIEQDLHPDVLARVLGLFFDARTNPLNAQLLCAARGPVIPELLHPSQVLLAEKDEGLATRLTRAGAG